MSIQATAAESNACSRINCSFVHQFSDYVSRLFREIMPVSLALAVIYLNLIPYFISIAFYLLIPIQDCDSDRFSGHNLQDTR